MRGGVGRKWLTLREQASFVLLLGIALKCIPALQMIILSLQIEVSFKHILEETGGNVVVNGILRDLH